MDSDIALLQEAEVIGVNHFFLAAASSKRKVQFNFKKIQICVLTWTRFPFLRSADWASLSESVFMTSESGDQPPDGIQISPELWESWKSCESGESLVSPLFEGIEAGGGFGVGGSGFRQLIGRG